MLANTSIQCGIHRAIWRGAQVLIGSVSVALVIACISFGLEISVATARSGVTVTERVPRQIVNYALKGDRRQFAPASHTNDVRQLPASDVKLAIGCESMISPLANPLLARVARRCLS